MNEEWPLGSAPLCHSSARRMVWLGPGASSFFLGFLSSCLEIFRNYGFFILEILRGLDLYFLAVLTLFNLEQRLRRYSTQKGGDTVQKIVKHPYFDFLSAISPNPEMILLSLFFHSVDNLLYFNNFPAFCINCG